MAATTWCRAWLALALGLAALVPVAGTCGPLPVEGTPGAGAHVAGTPVPVPVPVAAGSRSGLEIYARFHEGLADPDCAADSSSARWSRHFAHAPERMGQRDDDVLALFGYVVDALRETDLPTEYALIPFVESGYQPGARSKGGPAGLWQMAAITARAHHVPMRPGYDGRLSPVDSTRAAVRYLKTLHGMFAGDWRLAVMAYNAGEYRVFGALRRSGQVARSADPSKLTSLSGITRAYVRKLHALSCLLDDADEREAWMHALDRQVPVLEAVPLPPRAGNLSAWAKTQGRDAAMVRRLNPVFAGGRIATAGRAQAVLAPMAAVTEAPVLADASALADQPLALQANAMADATPAGSRAGILPAAVEPPPAAPAATGGPAAAPQAN